MNVVLLHHAGRGISLINTTLPLQGQTSYRHSTRNLEVGHLRMDHCLLLEIKDELASWEEVMPDVLNDASLESSVEEYLCIEEADLLD